MTFIFCSPYFYIEDHGAESTNKALLGWSCISHGARTSAVNFCLWSFTKFQAIFYDIPKKSKMCLQMNHLCRDVCILGYNTVCVENACHLHHEKLQHPQLPYCWVWGWNMTFLGLHLWWYPWNRVLGTRAQCQQHQTSRLQSLKHIILHDFQPVCLYLVQF